MKNKDFDAGRLLHIALGASFILALAYLLIYRVDGFPDEAARLGQLGDYLGGILNPTISVFTLFLAVGLWSLQKDELELTRNELAETKVAMEKQAKTAERQRQEQRFFDLLNVYQRTVDSIYFPYSNTCGKFALEKFLLDSSQPVLKAFLKNGMGSKQPSLTGIENDVITKNSLVSSWGSDKSFPSLDHYFRITFLILSEANVLLGDEHIRYIKLFRAQLSRAELIILGFNLWLDQDGQKMLPLAEKYGLLEHLPDGHLRKALLQELPKVLHPPPEANL